jgi:hypothetical protein
MKIDVLLKVVKGDINNQLIYKAYMNLEGEIYLYDRTDFNSLLEIFDDVEFEVSLHNRTANLLYRHGGFMVSQDDKKRLLTTIKKLKKF